MRILKISKVNTALVAIIMMTILLCCSSKVQADQSGDYTYTVTHEKAEITKYSGDGGDVTVPSTLGGFPVTSIGDYAFAKCTDINSISLPQGVKTIGYSTFLHCTGLTTINLPKGLTSIDEKAFEDCSGLTSITIPQGIIKINIGTFESCTSLTSISIPQGVTIIEWHAFGNCTSLKAVSLPQGVTYIGQYAFGYCTSLTSINLPQELRNIGYAAFTNTALTNIDLPQGLTNIDNQAFGGCKSLTSITFNSATTSIYDGEYTIPASTKILGYDPSTAKNYAQEYNRKFEVIGPDVTVTGVSLNINATAINVGASETLSATISPTNATNKEVTWDSSDTAIATVDSNGKVVGVSEGTAVITVTTADGGKTATCHVTIKIPQTTQVTKVSLNKKTTSINVGANITLIATIFPTKATNKEVTWNSSNTSIATVDSNGKVTGVSPGTATIIVTSVDGEKTAACKVTVKAVKVTKVSLNKKKTSINAGSNETLIATIAPTNAANQNVTWKSSNKAIATVDSNGNVVGVKAGTAVITVTTVDGKKTASCKVTILK